MSRTPFDTYAKEVTVDALSSRGRAETDVRVAPDPQFADVCFEPAVPRAAAAGELLYRLTSEGLTMLEFARQPPDVPEMGTWLSKHLAWWRRLRAEARGAKAQGAEADAWKEPPLFWGLSAGVAREAMAYFRLSPMDPSRWPRGCYEAAPGGRFRVVMIAELPRVRETLVVRTMGAGATFRGAVEDLAALPADAPERRLTLPHLARLRLEADNHYAEEEVAAMLEARRIYNEQMEANLQQGLARGRAQGLRPLERQFERRLARPLTAAEHATLLARLDSAGPDRLGDVVLDLDPAALAAWLADPAAR